MSYGSASPIVYMDAKTNSLHFSVRTNVSKTNATLGAVRDHKSQFLNATVEYVPLQRWVQFALIVKDNIMTILMDGELYTIENVLDMQKPNIKPLIIPHSGDLSIGSMAGSAGLKGYITKFDIFNYAINISDVKSIYNKGPFSTSETILSKLGESFDATNSDALGAIRSSSGSIDERMEMEIVSGAPISTIMTTMGSVRACGSVNTLCGTRDGYYAGNLIVGENMGVTGNINIHGSIKEVQDMSVLRALNVNGMAKLESVNMRSGEDLRVIGEATVQKMTVEGDTHVGGTLAVNKHVNMKGDAEVHGDMRGMKGVDVNNGVRVGQTFHVKGDVFLNKSCMHEDDFYTMGSAGAMGDMLTGKNLGTGKDHIVAGSGVVAGSTMVGRNLDVADNMDVLTNVSIGGDLNVS
eukprot:gene9587-biopygen5791